MQVPNRALTTGLLLVYWTAAMGASALESWRGLSMFPNPSMIGKSAAEPYARFNKPKGMPFQDSLVPGDYLVYNVDSTDASLLHGGFEFVRVKKTPKLDEAIDRILRKGHVSGERVGLKKDRQNFRALVFDLLFGSSRIATAEDNVAHEIIGINRGIGPLKGVLAHYILEASGFVLRSTRAGSVAASNVTDGAANNWHVDQDMNGEPFAPLVQAIPGVHLLFKLGVLRLVNLWMPLEGCLVRPLAVMDNRREQQRDRLHYSWGAKIKSDNSTKFKSDLFLLRFSEEFSQNHSPRRFFTSPSMHRGDAIMFSTTSTFHVAVPLPSDRILSLLTPFLLDTSTCAPQSLLREAHQVLQSQRDELGELTDAHVELLSRVVFTLDEICAGTLSNLASVVEPLVHDVIRTSLEMRLVLVVLPTAFAAEGAVATIGALLLARRLSLYGLLFR